jgi:hypothetical protein
MMEGIDSSEIPEIGSLFFPQPLWPMMLTLDFPPPPARESSYSYKNHKAMAECLLHSGKQRMVASLYFLYVSTLH